MGFNFKFVGIRSWLLLSGSYGECHCVLVPFLGGGGGGGVLVVVSWRPCENCRSL